MKNSHLKRSGPVWPDRHFYFLTDACFLHFPYFRSDDKKQIVLNQIKKIYTKLKIPVTDYSIAINHYHIKFYLENGKDLAKVKQLLRRGISYEYRKRYTTKYKDMWQTRKVSVLYTEKSCQLVSAYIVGNLLKHKEVSTFNDLKKNKYSSYYHKITLYNEKDIQNMIRKVIDVNEDTYGYVNTESMGNFKPT